MSYSIISVNEGECVGCHICEIVCSLTKERMVQPARSRITVFNLDNHLDLPLLCRQCSDAPCMEACPVDAISRSDSNVIEIDDEKCTSCKLCVRACPYSAIFLHPETEKAVTCDMCGGDPVCVRYCPTRCIQFLPYEESLEAENGSERARYSDLLRGVEL
jgi:carbon-monoxide dehydrogenase iron sulfur subunit